MHSWHSWNASGAYLLVRVSKEIHGIGRGAHAHVPVLAQVAVRASVTLPAVGRGHVPADAGLGDRARPHVARAVVRPPVPRQHPQRLQSHAFLAEVDAIVPVLEFVAELAIQGQVRLHWAHAALEVSALGAVHHVRIVRAGHLAGRAQLAHRLLRFVRILSQTLAFGARRVAERGKADGAGLAVVDGFDVPARAQKKGEEEVLSQAAF